MGNKKLIFISDLHIRKGQRQDEYKKVFNKTIKEIKTIKNIDSIIILGDVFHTKNVVSGESFDLAYYLIKELLEISDVLLIPGNHDGFTTTKKHSLKIFDNIAKELNEVANNNIIVSQKTEIIDNFDDYRFGHFCLFDDENKWKKIKVKDNEKKNIALYHGVIKTAKTDSNYKFKTGVNLKFFKDLNYKKGFFGDIHRFQFLDKNKDFLYPGSLITQNFGESNNKGFVEYDLENDKTKFHRIKNDYIYYNLIYDDKEKDYEKELAKLDGSKIRLKVKFKIPLDYSDYNNLISRLENVKNKEIIYKIKENCIEEEEKKQFETEVEQLNVSQVDVQEDLIKEIYNEDYKDSVDNSLNDFIKINKHYFSDTHDKVKDMPTDKLIWEVEKVKISDMVVYKNEKLEFDFKDLGIFAPNRTGKSALLDIILFSIYGRSHNVGGHNLQDIVSPFSKTNKGTSEVILSNNKDERYKICRGIEILNEDGKTTTDLIVSEQNENGNWESIGSGLYKMNSWLNKQFGSVEKAEILNFAIDKNIDAFLRKNPSSRISALTESLHLDILDYQKNYSRKDRRTLKNQLEKLQNIDFQNKLSQIYNKVEKKQNKINKLKEEKSNIEKKLSNVDKELLGTNPEKYKNKLKSLNKRIDKITDKLDKIDNKFAKLRKIDFDIKEKLGEIKNKNSQLRSNIGKYNKKLGQVESQIKSTNKVSKLVEKTDCNDIDCPLLNWATNIEIKHKKAKEKQGELIQTIKDMKISIKKHEEKINKLKRLFDLKKDLNYKEDSLKQELKYKEKDVEEYSKKLKKIERFDISDIGTLNSLDERLDDIESSIISLSSKIGSLNQKYEQINDMYDDYLEKSENYELVNLYIEILEKMKSKVMNVMIPKITQSANEFLDLIDIPYSLELNLDGTIYLEDDKGKRGIRTASGSENTFASLVLRISMIQNTFIPVFDILVLDEVTGLLDDRYKQKFGKMVEMIKEMTGMKLMFVTNVEEYKNLISEVLSIKKDEKMRYSKLMK